jgi:hypothetical protein
LLFRIMRNCSSSGRIYLLHMFMETAMKLCRIIIELRGMSLL